MDWRPTAEQMADRIRAAIRRDGEAAVPEILEAVADTMLAIDYPIPIERCLGTRREEQAALVESLASWFRNILKDGDPCARS